MLTTILLIIWLIGTAVLGIIISNQKKKIEQLQEFERISEDQFQRATENYSFALEQNGLFYKKNCELIDKLNAAESTIENLTNERDMERKKNLDKDMDMDFIMMEYKEELAKYQPQWGEKEYEHYKSKQK